MEIVKKQGYDCWFYFEDEVNVKLLLPPAMRSKSYVNVLRQISDLNLNINRKGSDFFVPKHRNKIASKLSMTVMCCFSHTFRKFY